MSLSFHNMRRRLAAQKAKETEKPVAKQEAPAEKPKKGKVKKGE